MLLMKNDLNLTRLGQNAIKTVQKLSDSPNLVRGIFLAFRTQQ